MPRMFRGKGAALDRMDNATLRGGGGGPFTKHQKREVGKAVEEIDQAASDALAKLTPQPK